MMSQTSQSFRSSNTTSSAQSKAMAGGSAQIRNVTCTAEARKQAIKETLLRK